VVAKNSSELLKGLIPLTVVQLQAVLCVGKVAVFSVVAPKQFDLAVLTAELLHLFDEGMRLEIRLCALP
jgi:hypothetical protein